MESGKFLGAEYAIAETTADGFESSELEHSEYFWWLFRRMQFFKESGVLIRCVVDVLQVGDRVCH